MYKHIVTKFVPLEYKRLTRSQGELVESEETYTFKGHVSYSFEHLVNSGVDIRDVKATIFTTPSNIEEALTYDGIAILVDKSYLKVRKIIPYFDAFTRKIAKYELIV